MVMASAKRDSPPSRFSEYQRSATGAAATAGRPCCRIVRSSRPRTKDTAGFLSQLELDGKSLSAVVRAQHDLVAAGQKAHRLAALAARIAPGDAHIKQLV